MEPKTKTIGETYRCPSCLRVGKMRYQYGSYFCDFCDQRWRADHLGHFLRAFEAGREYERKNKK